MGLDNSLLLKAILYNVGYVGNIPTREPLGATHINPKVLATKNVFQSFPNVDWTVKSLLEGLHRYHTTELRKIGKTSMIIGQAIFYKQFGSCKQSGFNWKLWLLSKKGLWPIDLKQETQGLMYSHPLLNIHRFEIQFQLLSSNSESSWHVVILSVHWSVKLYRVLTLCG